MVVGGFVLLFYNTAEGLVCGCWSTKSFKIETSNSKALWASKDKINFGIRSMGFILCVLCRSGGYFDHYSREQHDENLQLSTHRTPNNQKFKVLSNKARNVSDLVARHELSGGSPQSVNLNPRRTLQERLHGDTQ